MRVVNECYVNKLREIWHKEDFVELSFYYEKENFPYLDSSTFVPDDVSYWAKSIHKVELRKPIIIILL